MHNGLSFWGIFLKKNNWKRPKRTINATPNATPSLNMTLNVSYLVNTFFEHDIKCFIPRHRRTSYLFAHLGPCHRNRHRLRHRRSVWVRDSDSRSYLLDCGWSDVGEGQMASIRFLELELERATAMGLPWQCDDEERPVTGSLEELGWGNEAEGKQEGGGWRWVEGRWGGVRNGRGFWVCKELSRDANLTMGITNKRVICSYMSIS